MVLFGVIRLVDDGVAAAGVRVSEVVPCCAPHCGSTDAAFVYVRFPLCCCFVVALLLVFLN